jgi:hypothetical protein
MLAASTTPFLQFLPLCRFFQLAEWVAKNFADELDLSVTGDEWSAQDLNLIITRGNFSDRLGNILHTFQSVEFESDLYRGAMLVRSYQFIMAHSTLSVTVLS